MSDAFNDLSESTLSAIQEHFKHNESAQQEFLSQAKVDPKTESKLQLLAMYFPELPVDIIRAELNRAHGDEEVATIELFRIKAERDVEREALAREEARQKREQEERRRAQQVARERAESLMNVFHSIPKEVVQKILDDNNGDVEATTDALLEYVAQQEQAAATAEKRRREEKEQAERAKRRDTLRSVQERLAQFDLAENQIVRALEAHSYNVDPALAQLRGEVLAARTGELKKLFQWATDKEIRDALEASGLEKVAACEALTSLHNARKGAVAREQAGILVSKVAKKVLDWDSFPAQIAQDLTQSQMLRVEEKKGQEAGAIKDFKEKLATIIDTQARTGQSPGLLPAPSPKQIDKLLSDKQQAAGPAPVDPATAAAPPPAAVEKQAPPAAEGEARPAADPAAPLFAVTLTAVPGKVDAGSPIIVTFEVTSGTSTSSDWIGLFPVGVPHKQYDTYQWRGKEEKKGTLTFTAPNTDGVRTDYEFRYFRNRSYDAVALSNKITVGPEFDVQAQLCLPANKIAVRWRQVSGNQTYTRAWIGLYDAAKPNTQYIVWNHAGKPDSDMFFDAPIKPGQYELRLFPVRSYVHNATSPPVVIEGTDSLAVETADGKVSVTVNAVTFEPFDYPWVGLYQTVEQNNRNWVLYQKISSPRGTFSMKLPKIPGDYEARLFANGSYDVLLRSNTFNVPSALKQ